MRVVHRYKCRSQQLPAEAYIKYMAAILTLVTQTYDHVSRITTTVNEAFLFPQALTRGRVCDFVNHAKAFISEVNEQLWTLKPV